MQKTNMGHVPHVVFHMEGEADNGELVTIAREHHAFGETATIAQLFGKGWAFANKLENIRIDRVFVEIGMCEGRDRDE